MPFFSKYLLKTPYYHAHIQSKKRQNCQNYKILWAKKVNRMPFFPIFHEKMTFLMPIFYQKNVYSLKHTMLSSPHFVKKTSILSKTQCSHVIFFKFFMKNPQFHAHIWPNNFNSVKTTLYFGPKKIIGCPSFLVFTEK